MKISLLWVRLVAPLLFSMLALLFPALAKAVVFVGTFDPAYDTAVYANLGFRGTATIFVPDACVAGLTADTNLYPVSSAGCAGDQIHVSSATLTLYDLNSPAADVASATLLPLAPPAGPQVVNFLHYSANAQKITGADTDFFGAFVFDQLPSGFLAPSTAASLTLWMRFDDAANAPPTANGGYTGPGRVFVCDADPGLNATTCPGALSNPAAVTFTRVPEPASLALVLLAGVAGASARRLRRR